VGERGRANAVRFFHLVRGLPRLTSVDPAAAAMSEDSGRTRTTADDRWVAALRAGEPAALERMARSESPRVLGLLHSLLGPRADIEDLMQTVFLETCRALPGFRGDCAVSTFVGAICIRVARRAMRPSAWIRHRAEWDREPQAIDNPERAAEQSEQLRRLHLALSRLSSKKRAAFLLWSLEGLEVRAIADLMQASVPATKSRILYAQRELRQRAERDPYLRELVAGGNDGKR
jgi:RNA polymerase sigma-70 factor, ECF subfamily